MPCAWDIFIKFLLNYLQNIIRRSFYAVDYFTTSIFFSLLKTQHSKNKDHGIQFHLSMANRWRNNGNSDSFVFLGFKITADGDSSHNIKRLLLLGRKVMTNLVSLLKSKDITLPTKVRLVKAMIFPVVMYGCESWTIKKAEHWRMDAFELWCWRRLLRVPWTARRFNKSILKEISPEYSLEGLMLKLKLQCFGQLIWRTNSLENPLILRKIEGRRRRGWQRIRWLDGITNSTDMSLSKLGNWWWTRKLGVLQSMGSQRVEHNWVTELNWTELVTYNHLQLPPLGPTQGAGQGVGICVGEVCGY